MPTRGARGAKAAGSPEAAAAAGPPETLCIDDSDDSMDARKKATAAGTAAAASAAAAPASGRVLRSTAAAARVAVPEDASGRDVMCSFAVSCLLVGSGRAHTLTITRSDVKRLEDGEYLNDALVDFGVW